MLFPLSGAVADFYSRVFSSPDMQVQLIPVLDLCEKEYPGEKPVLLRLFKSCLEFVRGVRGDDRCRISDVCSYVCAIFVLRKDVQPPRF